MLDWWEGGMGRVEGAGSGKSRLYCSEYKSENGLCFLPHVAERNCIGISHQ